jgi:hypothetical protein
MGRNPQGRSQRVCWRMVERSRAMATNKKGPQTDLPLDHLCENFVKLTVYVVEIP